MQQDLTPHMCMQVQISLNCAAETHTHTERCILPPCVCVFHGGTSPQKPALSMCKQVCMHDAWGCMHSHGHDCTCILPVILAPPSLIHQPAAKDEVTPTQENQRPGSTAALEPSQQSFPTRCWERDSPARCCCPKQATAGSVRIHPPRWQMLHSPTRRRHKQTAACTSSRSSCRYNFPFAFLFLSQLIPRARSAGRVKRPFSGVRPQRRDVTMRLWIISDPRIDGEPWRALLLCSAAGIVQQRGSSLWSSPLERKDAACSAQCVCACVFCCGTSTRASAGHADVLWDPQWNSSGYRVHFMELHYCQDCKNVHVKLFLLWQKSK